MCVVVVNGNGRTDNNFNKNSKLTLLKGSNTYPTPFWTSSVPSPVTLP